MGTTLLMAGTKQTVHHSFPPTYCEPSYLNTEHT